MLDRFVPIRSVRSSSHNISVGCFSNNRQSVFETGPEREFPHFSKNTSNMTRANSSKPFRILYNRQHHVCVPGGRYDAPCPGSRYGTGLAGK